MTRVASIDIGTNSTRLLVADVDGTGRDAKLVPVERRTQITRLGQGVDRERTLRPEAITRTLEVLHYFAYPLAQRLVVSLDLRSRKFVLQILLEQICRVA